jgi:hypothetical protein
MLRIPLIPQACDQQRHNLQVLRGFTGGLKPDSTLKWLLPETLVELDCQGQPVFVERRCAGFDLRHCHHPEEQPAIFRLGLDFLLCLHRELDDRQVHSGLAIEAWLRKRAAHVYKTSWELPEDSLQGLVEDAMSCMRAEPPAVVCTHGDFWRGNLLSTPTGERLTGVVDWKFGDPQGMPLSDLLQLLLWTKGLSSGRGFTGELVKRLLARQFEEDEKTWIEEYCSQLGISGRATWALVFMGWLDWVYRRTSVHGYLPSWRQRELAGFLEATGEMTYATAPRANM